MEATTAEDRLRQEAEIRFVTGMIEHHQQALEMTGLVPSRAEREDLRLLARRIELSQEDEIALMRQWLDGRRETLEADPGHGGHEAHHPLEHPAAHGMLSRQEMATLAAVTGAEFDRLFLELMIRHHQGALVMVDELFAAGGTARDSDLFQIASHIDSDQRIEISRMQAMQRARP